MQSEKGAARKCGVFACRGVRRELGSRKVAPACKKRRSLALVRFALGEIGMSEGEARRNPGSFGIGRFAPTLPSPCTPRGRGKVSPARLRRPPSVGAPRLRILFLVVHNLDHQERLAEILQQTDSSFRLKEPPMI